MRNQQYYSYNPSPDSSPLPQNYDMRMRDLSATRPYQPLPANNVQYADSKLLSNYEKEARRIIQDSIYRETYDPMKTQKKHYRVHNDSEINRFGLLKQPQATPSSNNPGGYLFNPRPTNYIESLPDHLKSKTLRNEIGQKAMDSFHYMAQGYPRQIQEDVLDRLQQEQMQRAIPKTYERFNYTPNQNSYLQRPVHQEEIHPDKLQGDSSFDQRILENHKNKHVTFQEEPKEYVYEQEYPNDYTPQNDESKDQSFQNFQDFNNHPKMIPNYSSRNQDLERLDQEIANQQLFLAKKMQETMRGRAYNIVSNNITPNYQSYPRKRSYGSSIKAMQKNQEIILTGYENMLNWNPLNQLPSTPRGKDSFFPDDQMIIGQRYGESETIDALGRNNHYVQTNHRYGSQPPRSFPIQDPHYMPNNQQNFVRNY